MADDKKTVDFSEKQVLYFVFLIFVYIIFCFISDCHSSVRLTTQKFK